ncbi:peptidase C1 [Agrobacterium tumefaciens]|uniref:C1 family peptidase n=1 Tax=Agrobacterium tumefaciens TaxID=358 RepID=UPI0015745818|nr:C1 family peptidase [Agrobacterium tumefaciens]NTE68089.1 peptidase C1 [Agrobacterium tumefaciens]
MMQPVVKLDLRHLFGEVRDQGLRPTCLAFAVSDCHAAHRDGWEPLSTEFAFYQAQKRAGLPPTAGSALLHVLDAVREDGQPPEVSWPYLDDLPSDVSKWGPPPVSQKYFRASERADGSFADIVGHLSTGSPPVLVLTIGERFFMPDEYGMVRAATGEADVARHAVVAVASGENGEGNWLLVRNSWGAGWGIDGHAWVSEQYVSRRLHRLAVLKEDLSVSIHKTAA